MNVEVYQPRQSTGGVDKYSGKFHYCSLWGGSPAALLGRAGYALVISHAFLVFVYLCG